MKSKQTKINISISDVIAVLVVFSGIGLGVYFDNIAQQLTAFCVSFLGLIAIINSIAQKYLIE